MKLYQQIECSDSSTPYSATLVVWVESPTPPLGYFVTFPKETGDRKWLVTKTYATQVSGVNRGWGLDLPKSQRTER